MRLPVDRPLVRPSLGHDRPARALRSDSVGPFSPRVPLLRGFALALVVFLASFGAGVSCSVAIWGGP